MVLTDGDLDKCAQSGLVDVTSKYGVYAYCRITKTQGDLATCAMHRNLLEHCGVLSSSRMHANEVIHTAIGKPDQKVTDNRDLLELLLMNNIKLAQKRAEEIKVVSETEATTEYYTQYPIGHDDQTLGDAVYYDMYNRIYYNACIKIIKDIFEPLIRSAIHIKNLCTINAVICGVRRASTLICGENEYFQCDDMFEEVVSFVNTPNVNDWNIYMFVLGNCSLNTTFVEQFKIDFHTELVRAMLCAAPTFVVRRLMKRTLLCRAWDSMLDMLKKMPRSWPYGVKDYCAWFIVPQNDIVGDRTDVLMDNIMNTKYALLILQRLEDGINGAEESFRQRLLAEIRSRQKLVLTRMLTHEQNVLKTFPHSRYAWILELHNDDELRTVYESRFPHKVSVNMPSTPERLKKEDTKRVANKRKTSWKPFDP